VESHPSQSARDPLTRLRRALGYGSCRPYGTRFHFLRLTQDLRPGLLSAAPPGLTCRGVGFASQLRFGSPQARGTTERRALIRTENVPRGLKPGDFLVIFDAGMEGLLHPLTFFRHD
jgi:hypothetical protein